MLALSKEVQDKGQRVQDEGQQQSLFHTRRKITRDVNSMVIDSKSCASATLVEKLNLPTKKIS